MEDLCVSSFQKERGSVCLTQEENIRKSCVKVYMSARTEWQYGEKDAIAEGNIYKKIQIYLTLPD